MLQFVSIPLLFVYVLSEILSPHKTVIARNVLYIFGLVVLSVVMSFIVWGQDIVLGYRASAGFFSVLFFFFLKKAQFPEKDINRFVIVYGVIWIFTWAVNMVMFPMPVFGLLDQEHISEARGVARFFIQGDGFLYILFFFFLNRWMNANKKIYLALFVGIFIVIVMQVTRQTIAFCSLVALYYLLKKSRRIFIYLAVAAAIFLFIDFNIPKDSVIGKLVELSQDQYRDNSYGDRNVRLDEYEYFFTRYSPNIAAVVFGNGLPHDDSRYGRMYTELRNTMRYYYSDVGYAGIFIMMGILGLVVFVRFAFVLGFVKVYDKNILWTKMFLMYLFLCNTVSFVISVSIIPMVTALYLIDKNSAIEKKKG
ncbi:hypothetical protein [Fibrobacter sp. UWB12]|uniref:hypothetical protein n=1 Tax=Fibrobacter sp. UWB12 TaxID=1896203 RepID=UPI001114E986|nr:hypothetical protein [Fibrobacter sp. UWB12]